MNAATAAECDADAMHAHKCKAMYVCMFMTHAMLPGSSARSLVTGPQQLQRGGIRSHTAAITIRTITILRKISSGIDWDGLEELKVKP